MVERPDLRIISDDLWLSVKKRQKEIKDKTRGVFNKAKHLYSENLLTRIAICGACGGTFGVVSGGKYAKYGCTMNHTSGNNTCSNSLKIKKEVLEEAVITALCRDLMRKGSFIIGQTRDPLFARQSGQRCHKWQAES